MLVERDRRAEHATGRNGGICEASITHGEHNGRARWPEEFDRLQRLGMDNLDAIEETIDRYGIECGFRRGGSLTVATRPHQVAALRPDEEGFLDATAVREMINSPTCLAGRHAPRDSAVLDPARLAWGLATAAEAQGVRIVERTGLTSLTEGDGHVIASTTGGTVRANTVALATNVRRSARRFGRSRRDWRRRAWRTPR